MHFVYLFGCQSVIVGSGEGLKLLWVFFCFFFPILRGRAVLRFSHYKVFVFAVRALGFMKSALRITLHSPLS